MKNRISSVILVVFLTTAPSFSAAQQNGTISGDKGTDMVVDAVVMRPLGLVATLVGAVLTVVALPFTIPSGSVESSARELIVKPAEYTFTRPLGDFSDSDH
ncbi:MAG: hypothetical protein Q8K12_17400 [Thiobacillus sp.]|nr:hypothetical protein [Thiobacillus sp.]